ncbi:hypothetical protein PUN28_005958 [Cardiocondyla obscurior]|uniref:Uncharacterized protein n=1 Tax=Cardiocondyla obscurior TaxID=286306 RepID=A0AAW2G9B8_9HYME
MIFHGLPRILRIIKQWIFAFNRVHKSNALADTMRCFSSNNHSLVVERFLLFDLNIGRRFRKNQITLPASISFPMRY